MESGKVRAPPREPRARSGTLPPQSTKPKKNWDSGASLLVNFTVTAHLIHYLGFAAFLFAYGLPLGIATAAGCYLVYAQHKFPGVVVQPRESWSYTRAALESSSYLDARTSRCGRLSPPEDVEPRDAKDDRLPVGERVKSRESERAG